jgi:hypothetical protein
LWRTVVTGLEIDFDEKRFDHFAFDDESGRLGGHECGGAAYHCWQEGS